MAIVRVQGVEGKGAAVSSLAVTITASLAGSLLVISTRSTDTFTVTGVTDNKSNTWVQATGAYGTGAPGAADIWYSANSIAGVTSVTVTWSSVGIIYCSVLEYSGAKTSSPLDTANNFVTTYNSPIVGPSMVSSQAGSVGISAIYTGTNSATGANSPWTAVIVDSNGNVTADYVGAPAATIQCTFTDSGSSESYTSPGAIFLAAPTTNTALPTTTFLVF